MEAKVVVVLDDLLSFNRFEQEIGINVHYLQQAREYFYARKADDRYAAIATRAVIRRDLQRYFLDPDRFFDMGGTGGEVDDAKVESAPVEIRFDNLINARLELYLKERIVEVLDLLAGDLAVENVHDLRVAIKKIRVIAKCYGTYMSPATTKAVKQLAALFRRLGRVRDLDVVMELSGQKSLRKLRKKESAKCARLISRKKFLAKLERLLDKEVLVEAIDNVKGDVSSYNFNKVNRVKILEIQTNLEGYFSLFKSGRFDLTAYHRLRLVFKEYRYLLEFAGLEHLDHYIHVKEMTGLLGDIHDCNNLMVYASRPREESGLDVVLVKFDEKFNIFNFNLG
ncbi:MAG: CHAD domain-containing protein [Erysipelotrichaceae bacterium]|nr:CHAD domain-containing protein [Erysipelotrichaceae bacterium]